MSKKFLYLTLAILMLVSLFLVSCKDAIHDDLLSYNEKCAPILKLSSEFEKESNNLQPENFKSTVTDTIIPKAKKIREEFASLVMKTPEVNDLNSKMINVMDLYIDAFAKMVEAIDKGGDEASLDEAKDKIAQAENLTKEYDSKLDELAKKHNVVFKN